MNLSRFFESKIAAFLIILPFIKPASEITKSFDMIFDIWKGIAALLIIVCYAYSQKKINKPLCFLGLIQVIYFISTLINHGDIKTALVQGVSNIALLLYVDYLFEKNEKNAIRNFCLPAVFMAILTIITMFIFYPNGMYQVSSEAGNYLWGFDNASSLLFIPTITFLIIYAMYVNKRKTYIKAFLFTLLAFIAFLYVKSLTAFLTILLIIVGFVIIILYRKEIKIFSPKLTIPGLILLFIIVLCFWNKIPLFVNFIKEQGKYFSFKLRIIFWNKELFYFLKSPIIGYGVEYKTVLLNKIGIDHPHNFFMDILYRGGIAGVLSAILFFVSLIKNIKINDSIKSMVNICLFALLVAIMLDFYNDIYLIYPQMYLSYLLLAKRTYELPFNKIGRQRISSTRYISSCKTNSRLEVMKK